MNVPSLPAAPEGSFVHEAFFYVGGRDYLAGTLPFIESGLAAGEAVVVAVPKARLELIADGMSAADQQVVRFLDIEAFGRNPGRIMPAWLDVVAGSAVTASGVRGIGEPVWPGRSAAELEECRRHEALLNLAFRTTDRFRLWCPYDAGALDASVLRDACRNHPHLRSTRGTSPSSAFRPTVEQWLDGALPPPPAGVEPVPFDASTLSSVRRQAVLAAQAAGSPSTLVDDVALAVSEAATNCVRHGGGGGRVALWVDGDALLCDVCDDGCITDPLAGRVRPSADQLSGRGLWLIHQLCDLVQVRRGPAGQVVRLRFEF